MRKGRQNHKFYHSVEYIIYGFTHSKIEAVYFCTGLLVMKIHVGGNWGEGDEKQLIDLEWPKYLRGLDIIYLSSFTNTIWEL